jgi:hypothetical protein
MGKENFNLDCDDSAQLMPLMPQTPLQRAKHGIDTG